MTIRASEFDVLAAKVDAGELTEDEVVSWMAAAGWPGHSVLECQDWWETEYASRRDRPDVPASPPGDRPRAGDGERNQ
jgi:hypothetical protein